MDKPDELVNENMLPTLPGLGDKFVTAQPYSQPVTIPKIPTSGPFSLSAIGKENGKASVSSYDPFDEAQTRPGGKGIMASGKKAYDGAVATNDRSIPLGTKVTLGGKEYTVEDHMNSRFNYKTGTDPLAQQKMFDLVNLNGTSKQFGRQTLDYSHPTTPSAGPVTSSDISQTPKSASVGFDQTEGKPSIDPLGFLKGIGQSIARVGGSAALTLANTPEMPVDTTAPAWQQNIQKGIFGDKPVESFATRIAKTEVNAQGAGLGKASLPLAFAGVLGGDALNFLGGEGKAANLIGDLAKETDASKIAETLVSKGFARDVAESYAPTIAGTTDKKAVEEALQKATDFQLGTHVDPFQSTSIHTGEPMDAVDNHIATVFQELDAAQAGKRFLIPNAENDTYGYTAAKQGSTFPQWIPAELRTKPLLESVSNKLMTGESMTGKEAKLAEVIKTEIANRSGATADEITQKLMSEPDLSNMPITDHSVEPDISGRTKVSPTLKESFTQGVDSVTPKGNVVNTDAQSQAQAFADSMAGDLSKKGYGGFGQDLKDAFQGWVNERRASKVAGYFKSKEFTSLDGEGLDGIFKFQESKPTEGKLGELSKFFDDKYKLLKDTNIDLNYKQNYLPQLWNNTPEQIGEFTRKLGLKPSFTLESVIKDYKAGIEAGLTPKFTKLSDLAGWYEQRASKAVADRKFFDFLTKNNFIQPATNAPMGWKTLNPDNFPINSLVTEKGQYTGVFKAPPDLSNVINNYLSNPSGPISSFAKFASTTKNIVLSSGIPETGINAHGFNILARNALSANNPIGGFLRGSYWLANPNAAEKYLLKNSENALFFTQHGLTLSTEEHALQNFDGANIAQKGVGKLLSFQQKHFEVPLFNKIIPAMKVERTSVIFQDLLKHYPSDQAAKLASTITNNIFGGMNWEAMGRNRETQNLLRSIVLAPDWAESNLKLGKNIPKAVFSPNNPVGKAYRIMARNLVLAYTAANITNHATTGHWMWDNDAGHTFEIGIGHTADGKVRYIRPFGTAADFVRIPYDVALSFAKGDLSSVGRVVLNRLSTPLKAGLGLVANVDTFGRPITGKDKYGRPIPVKQQIGGVANQIGSMGIPQYGQALIDLATGKNNVEQTVAKGLELPFNYVTPYNPNKGNSSLGGLPGGGTKTSLPGLKGGVPKLPGL